MLAKEVRRNSRILQPSLPMPREFYVLPQFTDELQSRHDAVRDIMEALVKAAVGSTSQYDELISKVGRTQFTLSDSDLISMSLSFPLGCSRCCPAGVADSKGVMA